MDAANTVDEAQTNTAPVAPAPPPDTYWTGLARDAYNDSTSYFDASIRPQVNAAIRQFQGQHPTGSKYLSDTYKGRARFFRPKTRASVRKSEAAAAEAFFTTNRVVQCEAEDDGDPKKQLGAELMGHLLQYRLKKSIPWFLTCIGGYQDAKVTGVCISHNYWHFDPVKKVDKPCIDLLPAENFRFSPGADWTDPINTSPYLIRLIPMYVKDVEAKMTRPDHKTGLPAWRKADQAQILAATTLQIDSTRMTRERGRTDSQTQPSTITPFTIVWVHQNIVEEDGVDMLFYTLGTTFLLTDARPLEQTYFHKKRPFTLGYVAMEAHKNYPDGPVGLTKETQREINEIANQRIDNVSFAMTKRYFGKRGAQIDIKSLVNNRVGAVTLMTDPATDVKVVDTPDVTASSYQEQDRLNADFDDLAGSFSSSSVDTNRRMSETVGGMNLLSTTANQVTAYELHTFVETWVEPTLSQLALLEAHYETDDVILNMAGRKAGLTAEMLASGELDSLLMNEVTLNISVGIGSTNPQERINNLLKGMLAIKQVLVDPTLVNYGLKVQELIEEVFGALGHKDGARFFDMTDDPRITALRTQLQGVQQQLAQKKDPELVAAQVRKLDADAMESRMRMFFASGQAAEMIAAIPALSPLMDALAKACGYVPPQDGQDPGLPQPAAAAPGITLNDVKDPRTGTQFTPGGAQPSSTVLPAQPQLPATPGIGANRGIETVRADS